MQVLRRAFAEARADDVTDSWYSAALNEVDDPVTRAAVTAERSLLSALEAGCTAPVGAFATVDGDLLTLTGAVIAVDGSAEVRGAATGHVGSSDELGRELAAELIGRGAADLLAAGR